MSIRISGGGGGGGSGTPGGSDTQVQFNDSSSFGGDAGLTYEKSTDILTVAGNVTTPKVTTAGTLMTIENTGDTFGTVRMLLKNRNGSNGAVFENAGLDLVDFGFLTNTSAQYNLRYEHRSGQLIDSANSDGEFQMLLGVSPFTKFAGMGTGAIVFPNSGMKVAGDITPYSDDGAKLGTTSLKFSDLFLASGAVINFNSGNATVTHSAGLLTSNVDIVVPAEVYGSGWNGSNEAPTKNDVYDKVETLDTREIDLFKAVMLDTTGDCIIEPYTILASNDKFGHAILRCGANNAAAPTVKAGFYGRARIPDDYNGGTVTLTIHWTSTLTSGDVVFDFDYRAIGGDDTESLDQATYQESLTVTDTAPSAANERQVATVALTAANLEAGDTIEYFFGRDGADSSDTLAGSAIVHEVFIKYLAAA